MSDTNTYGMSSFLTCVLICYFLQLISLKRIGAEGAGVIWGEVGPHVNQVGSFSLQGDHIEALAHQVVAWYEGCRPALAAAPSLTGQNRGGEVWEKEEEAQGERGWSWNAEHGWTPRDRQR